ncbi:MAG: 4-hydroxy-tetrahydrodipicolinate reductase [Candidatus Altiarchaeales archaeon WOR_SM1_86-2]|nr:MAG: 4-hydroxy-tetrahydrodipicolinate reductase [Candidatus Altiarchaeales archaeon WOR_SM1_86-2]
MRIGLIGIGRMGKGIAGMALDEGMEVVAAVDVPENPNIGKDIGLLVGHEATGVKVSSSENLNEILNESKPEVMVDFSTSEACVKNSKTVVENRIDMVIGTTGFSDAQIQEIKDNILANDAGAVIAPNMSVGVNVFFKTAGELTKLLKDRGYDIEIVEAHHIFKKDAPSGTALRAARVIADALGKNLDDVAVYGRKGLKERSKDEIGIHAVRAGDIVGEHTVIFSTQGESIRLEHRAHSRDAFVKGVIEAIKFIKGKKGLYDMGDVIGV